MTGVPAITTAYTHVSTVQLPIVPPLLATPLRQVSGTVTPVTGTVRALQRFAGISGPKVEVAWGSVDPDTGAFSFALPVDAPVKAAYVANPASPLFAPDAAAAGQYTIEAASNGALLSRTINTTVAVPPIGFVFP
jgi:hypothetical protein